MEFDNFDFVKNMSEEQKQKLIEKRVHTPETKKSQKPSVNQAEFEFTMKPVDDPSSVMGTPVNKTPKENKFIDHGTEHKDEQNATPEVELTERRRPAFQKVSQTCTRCQANIETHPQFKRDFYVCDKCLKR